MKITSRAAPRYLSWCQGYPADCPRVLKILLGVSSLAPPCAPNANAAGGCDASGGATVKSATTTNFDRRPTRQLLANEGEWPEDADADADADEEDSDGALARRAQPSLVFLFGDGQRGEPSDRATRRLTAPQEPLRGLWRFGGEGAATAPREPAAAPPPPLPRVSVRSYLALLEAIVSEHRQLRLVLAQYQQVGRVLYGFRFVSVRSCTPRPPLICALPWLAARKTWSKKARTGRSRAATSAAATPPRASSRTAARPSRSGASSRSRRGRTRRSAGGHDGTGWRGRGERGLAC